MLKNKVIMAKNKKQVRSWYSQEFKNIFFGVILIFIWVLGFFGSKDSVIWWFLIDLLETLFWKYSIYLFWPVLILLWALISFHKLIWNYSRVVGLLLFWISICSLIWFLSPNNWWVFDFSVFLINIFGKTPAFFLILAWSLISLYLIYRISYIKVLKHVWNQINNLKENAKDIKNDVVKDLKNKKEEKPRKSDYQEELDVLNEKIKELSSKWNKQQNVKIEKKEPVEIKKVPVEKKSILNFFTSKEDEKIKKAPQMEMRFTSWDFPSSELLRKNEKKNVIDENFVIKQSYQIEKTLLEFNIKVEMKWYTVGPTVIQYRLKPSEWVKLNKIENLKKDLTLALKAKSIRIQAPIPWLGLVGIEVPNEKRDIVAIRELIESNSFLNHKSNLALVIGKDINWDSIVGDLAKMPHLLIAWQTWSGKSVAMNGFILSLLYKNSPDMLRLIMIDPKRVELSIYNGIPHLLAPIISDHEKALNSLKWCVAEMMRRYDIMTQSRSRNLEEYNKKVVKKERMPNIVIIIDELAELMWRNNKKDVENAITRMAQLGRASWMHLLVATQRPSVDVITGLIKANIPSRIALTVASQVDSRTILDQMWAEDLVWYWDMLFSPIGSEPERIQWVLVETDEVESVVNHIKRTIDPSMLDDLYDNAITEWESSSSMVDWVQWDYDEDPKILEEAIKICREAWKASTSLLQRRLKLWYARAARVIDILEEMWIVWPADGSKPRDVF